jgi:acyl-coenzyme A thioesterase PaaI-like protein
VHGGVWVAFGDIGRPLHIGRRTQVWEVRISNGEKAAAFFSCTQMVL